MSLNKTPTSERVRIGLFGRTNAGKSSLINALTGQNLAIVSPIAGTTTDPVSKTMEILPLGPVVLIDTAGLGDTSELGQERMKKTVQTLEKVDIALLIIEGNHAVSEKETQILTAFHAKNINYIIVRNKADLYENKQEKTAENEIWVSAQTGENIDALKEKLAHLAVLTEKEPPIVADFIKPNDVVLLVVPIDSAAPKGRLILPQQQTIRELLDAGAQAIITKEDALEQTLKRFSAAVSLVITDSQVFEKVAAVTPKDIPLTSFSILMARHKGTLKAAVEGAEMLDCLQDGDKILISEGCTHHRQCEDIGTVKLPKWIAEYTGKKLNFSFTSGGDFAENIGEIKLIIHCGGCMLSPREMKYRSQSAASANIPMTNYGTAIAKLKGILSRSIAPIPEFSVKNYELTDEAK